MIIKLYRIENKDIPHQWYAWYPVVIDRELVWLQKIWRWPSPSGKPWNYGLENPYKNKNTTYD